MADWATISALATAGGTMVLAGATFASVRSANRAARLAERSLLVGLRPLLVPSRPEDPAEKVHFADGKWVVAPGGGAAAEVTDEAIYLAMPLRNVGSGLAVLHGWQLYRGRRLDSEPTPLADFHRLTRDLYVAPSDVGFWQGAFRDPKAEEFSTARAAIAERDTLTIDLLYGDHEGGQRIVTRFAVLPAGEDQWRAAAGRHFNVDRSDPR